MHRLEELHINFIGIFVTNFFKLDFGDQSALTQEHQFK